MKVIIIGKKNHLFWVENCVDAFSEIGCEVKPIFLNKNGILNDLNKNILKIVSRKLSIQYLVNTIENKISFYKPDLILVISPFLLPPQISEMLSTFDKVKKLAWVGDRFKIENKIIAQNYDHFFYTDSYFVEEAKIFSFPSGEYLPLAYNRNTFYNKMNKNRINKLLFIGKIDEARAHFINSLDQVDLKLIGKRTKKMVNNKFDIVDRNINLLDVMNEYNKTNYVLNIKQETNVVNALNMRSFEAPASGCCLFQDNVKDIKYNFEADKDIVVYNNAQELIEYIKKYNKDSFSLNKIIKRGQRNVEANHQYLNRIKKMIINFK